MFNVVSFKLQLTQKVATSCTWNQSGGLCHIWMQSWWDRDWTAGQHHCGMGVKKLLLVLPCTNEKTWGHFTWADKKLFLHEGCPLRAWPGWGGFDIAGAIFREECLHLCHLSFPRLKNKRVRWCYVCMYERVVYELIVDATCTGTD